MQHMGQSVKWWKLSRVAGAAGAAGTAVAFAGLLVAPALAQGTVTGRISIQEKPGTKTTDLGNAVIYLEPRNGTARVSATNTQIAMNGRAFAPHVRIVTAGSKVEFPNQDPFTHNAFSTAVGALFDLGAYGNGKSKSAEFKKPGAYPIYCNVHAKMSGYVVVVNTPWYTQAGNDGRWEIGKVPAGTYTMTVWHERAPSPVTSEIRVPPAGLAALETKLDASGYKEVAHKDKNGKDYSTHGVVY